MCLVFCGLLGQRALQGGAEYWLLLEILVRFVLMKTKLKAVVHSCSAPQTQLSQEVTSFKRRRQQRNGTENEMRFSPSGSSQLFGVVFTMWPGSGAGSPC